MRFARSVVCGMSRACLRIRTRQCVSHYVSLVPTSKSKNTRKHPENEVKTSAPSTLISFIKGKFQICTTDLKHSPFLKIKKVLHVRVHNYSQDGGSVFSATSAIIRRH